jgi:hypothetical protein
MGYLDKKFMDQIVLLSGSDAFVYLEEGET